MIKLLTEERINIPEEVCWLDFSLAFGNRIKINLFFNTWRAFLEVL